MPDGDDLARALDRWWGDQTLKGDQQRNPRLVEDAFAAGWKAAIAAVRADRLFLEKIAGEERESEREQSEWERLHRDWGRG